MIHPVYRVESFEIVGPYRLRIRFDDGLVRTVDFSRVVEGELYGPLRDLGVFNIVTIDAEVHTLVWPNGSDFDPATLHDWPDHEAAFAAMAKGWARSPSDSPSEPK